MGPTEPHELTELVADLTVVLDVIVPTRMASSEPENRVARALGAFQRAWVDADRDRAARTADLGNRIAAAGMALLEGDPLTARRLVALQPGALA